ncbi:putative death-receptor fusion protein-domain-containing protein [Hypoxylon crocopeplum]|nr:putative death-receptor fusion protein-domain-containing protein [Hypoxylon crocopeplum]
MKRGEKLQIRPYLSPNLSMDSSILSGVGDTDFNPKHAVSWLEVQPENLQLWQAVFQELLLFAEKPRQSSGNACVKLYGFVDQCSKSTKSALRDFAFAENTALRLFDFFMEWNEQDSHRSMRLVLDFLAYFISKNPAPEVGASVKAAILNITMSIIAGQSSLPSVKSAMLALDHFIQKKTVYLCSVLGIYRETPGSPSDETALWDTLIAKIFAWMELRHVCTVAGKLLVTIFTSSWYEDRDVRHQPHAWHEFIYRGLQTNLEYLEPIKLYIFVPLFKADQAGSLVYLHHLSTLQRLTSEDSNGWDLNSMLWLAMLEAGKKVGVVDEPGHEYKKQSQSLAHLRADILESVLCHNSHEARSSAVSILIASPSTTKPYTAEALHLLKQHLPSFHEDSDPKMRYDILGYSRNMIKRIQSTVESLRREDEWISKKINKTGLNKTVPNLSTTKPNRGQIEKQQEDTIAELRATLRQHEDFVSWYVEFLKSELAPTTSYQRHITALKAMGFIIKPSTPPGSNAASSSSFELSSLLVDATWFRSILDLIMDPFDDVRETATSLIMSLSLEGSNSALQKQINGLKGSPAEELQSFCRKADELARKTARADHSDGVARSFELVCRWSTSSEDRIQIPLTVLSSLEAKLSAAETDLATAVLQAPVHGSFASLRYIWSSLSITKFSEKDLQTLAEMQTRAIACCSRIWQTVRHVLCDDSPEGHLPEELEEVEGLDTKDLLSYSFRAIHESSNLMRTIANNARQNRGQGLLAPSKQNFEAIGRLTFDELSNLRHRGAFTTVSQTFTSCCQLVKYFPDDGSSLLDEWYKGAVTCIHTQASTTRRSAGIPALIVGILSSNADHPSFEDVIRTLQDIGRRTALVSETDGSNLSQVHALNCIKDIFKSSYLSKRAEPYLTDCLQLAATSLKSEIWAIRNCGLLLLRSLVDCLFGTSESKMSIEAGWDGRAVKISYHKFQALPPLLVNLLEMGQQSKGVLIGTQTAESVFPALDIIRRAGPPDEFRNNLYDIIAWYLGSHIWHVREIAARTLCSFLLKPGWVESVADLLASSGASANKLHGALLTLKFLLERLADVMPNQLSDENVRAAHNLLTELPSTHHCISTCSEARAVYIEIIGFITRLSQTRNPLGEDLATRPLDIQPPSALKFDTQLNKNIAPSALLDIRLGQAAVQQALQNFNSGAGNALGHVLTAALKDDINVVCSMLEDLSSIGPSQSGEAEANLVDAYIQVCLDTAAPEPRTIALESLAVLMDGMLCNRSGERLTHLPANEVVAQLWTDLHGKPFNPSLSDAIIRVSGPLLAIIILCSDSASRDDLEPWLRSWGVMMGDAGMADRTFDTRMAAVEAMASFSTSVTFTNETTPSSAHLPWLLALYDALNDDDDEIRAAASSAATPILSNQRLISVEAGRRLLRWLVIHYGAADEFRAHVACRMAGHTPSPPPDPRNPSIDTLLAGWTPTEAQLAEAMRFDDSLFVIEEQNLYVDEVREAHRWRGVFASLPSPSSSLSVSCSAIEATLSRWTLAGLQTLTRIAKAEGRDGPLGWTSKPEVFAICARVLVSGSALAVAGDTGVRGELRRFRDEGRGAEVHGLLLGMCDGLDG